MINLLEKIVKGQGGFFEKSTPVVALRATPFQASPEMAPLRRFAPAPLIKGSQ